MPYMKGAFLKARGRSVRTLFVLLLAVPVVPRGSDEDRSMHKARPSPFGVSVGTWAMLRLQLERSD